MDVTVLALACLVLTVVNAILAGSVPYLWWQFFQQKQQLADLDEAVARLCQLAGVPPEKATGTDVVSPAALRRGG